MQKVSLLEQRSTKEKEETRKQRSNPSRAQPRGDRAGMRLKLKLEPVKTMIYKKG